MLASNTLQSIVCDLPITRDFGQKLLVYGLDKSGGLVKHLLAVEADARYVALVHVIHRLVPAEQLFWHQDLGQDAVPWLSDHSLLLDHDALLFEVKVSLEPLEEALSLAPIHVEGYLLFGTQARLVHWYVAVMLWDLLELGVQDIAHHECFLDLPA